MAEEEVSLVEEVLPLDKNNPIYTSCYDDCWAATKNDEGCSEMCYDSMMGYSTSEKPF